MKLLVCAGFLLSCMAYITEATLCRRPVDIMFAMDASGSMMGREFLYQKRFVQLLSRKFGISKRGTHAGVISFSSDARVDIKLGQHPSWLPFALAVRNKVKLVGEDTRFDLALRAADRAFRERRASRRSVPKVLVMMTNGFQSSGEDGKPRLDRVVLPLRKSGVRVFAIGVQHPRRRTINTKELRLLVERQSDLFTARSFFNLPRQASDIAARICAGAIPTVFAIYPLNTQTRGRDISGHRAPTALISRQVRSDTGPYGRHGGAFLLTGSRNSYIEIPNHVGGKLDTKVAISIFLWVYFYSNPGPIINYRRNGHGVGLWYHGRGGGLSANFIGRNGYSRRRLSIRGLRPLRWYYVGLTYDNGNGFGGLWINGRQVRRKRIGHIELSTQYPIRLGEIHRVRQRFKGKVTCLQIYPTALNRNQILSIKRRCAARYNADPCRSRPCLNGGSCILSSSTSSGYRCRCRAGYAGGICETYESRATARPTNRRTTRPRPAPVGPSPPPTTPRRRTSTRPPATTRPRITTRRPGVSGTPIQYPDAFRIRLLDYINTFRRLHGVGPVIISNTMNTAAQKWSLRISRLGAAHRDPATKYGANICIRRGARVTLAKSCVHEWYEAVKNYNWHSRQLSTASMQFVQMIWKSSLYVGIGAVRGGLGRFYVVVYFDPAGNRKGQMKEDVPGYTDVFLVMPQARCQRGFSQFLGSCYKYHSNKETWDSAGRNCITHNSTLLSVHGGQEIDSLSRMPVQRKDGVIWTGLNDRLNEGVYIYTDGSGVEYTDWKPGRPSGTGHNCVGLQLSVKNRLNRFGVMTDLKCNERHQFICRKPLEGLVTYRLILDMTSMIWVRDLALPGTLAFLQLKTKFEEAIIGMFGKDPTFVSAMVEDFRASISPPNKRSGRPSSRPRPPSSSPRRPSSGPRRPPIRPRRPPGRPRRPSGSGTAGRPSSSPKSGSSGSSAGSRKVTASIILKFGPGVKPDPTLPLQKALAKNKGKIPSPVDQKVVIKKIRILKPGEGPAKIGTCMSSCANQCTSTCNPLCCSSKIATHVPNPLMANMYLQQRMAMMQRLQPGISRALGHNQMQPPMGQLPIQPMPMQQMQPRPLGHRCLPRIGSTCPPQGQRPHISSLQLPMAQQPMQQQMIQANLQTPLKQRALGQPCVSRLGQPCLPGQMQRPQMPMQNPLLQRLQLQRQMMPMNLQNRLMQRPLGQPCVSRLGQPCLPGQMQRPQMPMQNPLLQRLQLQRQMMTMNLQNPLMQRPLSQPCVSRLGQPCLPGQMQRPQMPMQNPLLQRLQLQRQMMTMNLQNPSMQRPLGQPCVSRLGQPCLPGQMQRPQMPMQNPLLQRLQLQRQMMTMNLQNPLMQRSLGQPCVSRLGQPCLPGQMQRPQMPMQNPLLQRLQLQRQMMTMNLQNPLMQRSLGQPCVSRLGQPCLPGQMQRPQMPMQNPLLQRLQLQRQMMPMNLQNPLMQRPLGQPCVPRLGQSCLPGQIQGPQLPMQNPLLLQQQQNMMQKPRTFTISVPKQKKDFYVPMWPAPKELKQQPPAPSQQMLLPITLQMGCTPTPGSICPPNGRINYPAQALYPRQSSVSPGLPVRRPPFMPQPRMVSPLWPMGIQMPLQRPGFAPCIPTPTTQCLPSSRKAGMGKKPLRTGKVLKLQGAPLPSVVNYVMFPPPIQQQGLYPMQKPCIPSLLRPCKKRTKGGGSRSVLPVSKLMQQNPAMMQQPMGMGPFMPNVMGMRIRSPCVPTNTNSCQGRAPPFAQGVHPMLAQISAQQPAQVVQAGDLPKLLQQAQNPIQQSVIMALLNPLAVQPPLLNIGPRKEVKGKKKGRGSKLINMKGQNLPTLHIIYPPQPFFPMQNPCVPMMGKPCLRPMGRLPISPRIPLRPPMMQRPIVGPMPMPMQRPMQMSQPMVIPVQRPMPMPMLRPMPMQIPQRMAMPMQRPMAIPMQRPMPMPMQFPHPCIPSQLNSCQPKRLRVKGKKGKKGKKPKVINMQGAPLPFTIIYPPQPMMPMQNPCVPKPGAPCSGPAGTPLQRPMVGPLPMQRPMQMPQTMPMPRRMPIQRPMPMPMQFPQPCIPSQVNRCLPRWTAKKGKKGKKGKKTKNFTIFYPPQLMTPMQNPCVMGTGAPCPRPAAMRTPLQRPMVGPMSMQRPMQMPRTMPMQRPMQIPRPMPMQRPMQMPQPMPMQRPMQMPQPVPMQRPLPMAMPMQFQQPCIPSQQNICPPRRQPAKGKKSKKGKKGKKGMKSKKPSVINMQGAPLPFTIIYPPQPMMPMQNPCVPKPGAPCSGPAGTPLQRPMVGQLPMQRPMQMPRTMPMQRPMQIPRPMPMQRPMQRPMQMPQPMPMQRPMQMPQPVPMQRPLPMAMPMQFQQPCIPSQQNICPPRRQPAKGNKSKKGKKGKKGMKSKKLSVINMQGAPLPFTIIYPPQPMPIQRPYGPIQKQGGTPCVTSPFRSCPPIGMQQSMGMMPQMPFRHPAAGLMPITPPPMIAAQNIQTPVSPVVVNLPHIILKYPVSKKQLPVRPPVPARPHMLPQKPLLNPMGSNLPFHLQRPFPSPVGMPPFIRPSNCVFSCLHPAGPFCPNYCPKSCCRAGIMNRNRNFGKKSKIPKAKKH